MPEAKSETYEEVAAKTNRKLDETQRLVTERGRVHGDFGDVATVSGALLGIATASKNWHRMTPTQREGLRMIFHKAARILSGDPDHNDHWDDIAGYARITSERIPQAKNFKIDPPPIPVEVSDMLRGTFETSKRLVD